MRNYAKTIVGLSGVVTLAAFIAAAIATVHAHRYSTRTAEDFVYVYVFIAWVGVAILAAAGGSLSWWVIRRERRR